jgi:hypothetical protein
MWEIFVPTEMSGKPVRTRYHRVWDQKVRAITHGLTVYHPAKGQWVNPDNGELHLERMIPVRSACTPAQMDLIADMTLTYYQQKAVMYYQVSDKVFVKRAE